MPQSYWHLTGNLWALALSTVIALFLPDFGPMERMDGGVGVVIRATMAVPLVFSFLYWTGRLIINLTEKLKKWWLMSIITAGIEQGIRDVAERRAKNMAKDIAESMAKDIAERHARKHRRKARDIAESMAKNIAESMAKTSPEKHGQEYRQRLGRGGEGRGQAVHAKQGRF